MRAASRLQVREAQLAQYNYILVLGEEEKAAGTVNVRTRDNQVRCQGGHLVRGPAMWHVQKTEVLVRIQNAYAMAF